MAIVGTGWGLQGSGAHQDQHSPQKSILCKQLKGLEHKEIVSAKGDEKAVSLTWSRCMRVFNYHTRLRMHEMVTCQLDTSQKEWLT